MQLAGRLDASIAILNDLKAWNIDRHSFLHFYRSNVVGFYSFNAERQRLSSQVQLVVQDALKGEAVLDKTLIIHQNFMRNFEPDDESILDAFYQEVAHTVAREVSPLFD